METQTVSERESSYSVMQLKEMIASYLGSDNVPQRFKIVTDTSDFFRVDYNDVVILDEIPYLMRNYTREGRFGLDDEPKYWVRKAIDLKNREAKIIKLVFHEEIDARVGDIVFRCVRSPAKEAAILEMVAGHKNFMQGRAVPDKAGNLVRILFSNWPRIMKLFFISTFLTIWPCLQKWSRLLAFCMNRGRNMGISGVIIYFLTGKQARTVG